MMVPLDQIATITMGKGPAQIQHPDGKRMIAVSANAQGRSPGEVTADAMKIAKQIDFPTGYGLELGGASRDQKEVFSEMGIALVMGIALMYLVLVMQFGSFTAPLPVMLSLPLSLIGVVLALLATGGTLNLMSFIGVIMLMGLVAKNAILLLDCARKEEAQGVTREEALMHAGRVRLRPILMTTFALIAGMLPVAHRPGRGRRVLPPDGGGDHRRHDHLDDPDAAGGADLLRLHRDLARPGHREVPRARGAVERVLRLRGHVRRGAARPRGHPGGVAPREEAPWQGDPPRGRGPGAPEPVAGD